MFKRIFSICMALAVLALAFTNASPSRAQEGDPPGTESPTISMIAVINPSADSSISNPVSYQGELYFGANGGDGAGDELWKYGSTFSAQRVADIVAGPGESSPYDLAVYNGTLYFSATSTGTARELWK